MFNLPDTCTTIEFNGQNYYRYPESSAGNARKYFHTRDGKRLHIEIYKAYNGSIPQGMVVHHQDGNYLNNDPSNLVLMDRGEHMRLHNLERPSVTVNTPHARAKLAEYHRTAEGRANQGEHTKAYWSKVRTEPGRKVICCVCGQEFETRCTKPASYCSSRCYQRKRRADLKAAEGGP